MKRSQQQLDLFEYQEGAEDSLHRLRVEQDKIRKSFHVRYNVVLKELDKIQEELDYMEGKIKYEKNQKIKAI